jgi:hypothetical protein
MGRKPGSVQGKSLAKHTFPLWDLFSRSCWERNLDALAALLGAADRLIDDASHANLTSDNETA